MKMEYRRMPYNADTDRVRVSNEVHTYGEGEMWQINERVRTLVEKLQNNRFVEKAWVVQSFSDSRKQYVISKMKNGEWKCSCPMFRFNIPAGRYLHKAYKLPSGQLVCKHIAWVYQNQHLLVPIIDRGVGEREEVNEYAVNLVDWEGAGGRIRTVSNRLVKSFNHTILDELEGDEEEIKVDEPVFLDEYEQNARIEGMKEAKDNKKQKYRDYDIELGY